MISKIIKSVLVGDGETRKSSLLISYTSNIFANDYIPTIFDNYEANIIIADQTIKLTFWDTAGNPNYDSLRPLSYNNCDIVLFCFSLVSLPTFYNIKLRWNLEIDTYCQNVSKILVGTKRDLCQNSTIRRELKDMHMNPISHEEAIFMMSDIGASTYREISAVRQEGLHELFTDVVKITLQNMRSTVVVKKRKKCILF